MQVQLVGLAEEAESERCGEASYNTSLHYVTATFPLCKA